MAWLYRLRVVGTRGTDRRLRVTKFRKPGTGRQGLDIDAFRQAVRITSVALEVLISFADYPTLETAEVTRKHRPIGLGYCDLGAYLMLEGLPYETDGAETWESAGNQEVAALTSLMTAEVYKTSALLAAVVGPYDAFEQNREAHLAALRLHLGPELREALVVPGRCRYGRSGQFRVGRGARARRAVRPEE